MYTAPRDTLTPAYRFACTYRYKGKLGSRPLQVGLAFTDYSATRATKHAATALLLWGASNMVLSVEHTVAVDRSGASCHLLAIDIPATTFVAISSQPVLAVQIENDRIVLGPNQMRVLRAVARQLTIVD